MAPDTRSEQEQIDDLLKQYMEETKIDSQYKDEFDALVNDMESRVQKLKGNTSSNTKPEKELPESEDEEEIVKKIVEKVRTYSY